MTDPTGPSPAATKEHEPPALEPQEEDRGGLYRTVVVVEVLHRGLLEFDDLRELSNLIDDGDGISGNYEVQVPEALTPAQMSAALRRHGCDPTLLLTQQELASPPEEE